MGIKIHATIVVDPQAWAEEYGVDLAEVGNDARSYVLTHLQGATGPFVSVTVRGT